MMPNEMSAAECADEIDRFKAEIEGPKSPVEYSSKTVRAWDYAAATMHKVDYMSPYILGLINAERKRQDAKWGISQNSPFEWMSILGEEYGELCTATNETYFQHPTHPEKGGDENIIREASHVAATAVALIEQVLRDQERKDGEKA